MDSDEYRDRFAHEFDEDVGAYEDRVQEEAASLVEETAYDDLYGRVMHLDRDDPDADVEDGEALEAYHHIENGEWENLDQGQITCLYRVLGSVVEDGNEGRMEQYQALRNKAKEIGYVFDLGNALDRVDSEYLGKDFEG